MTKSNQEMYAHIKVKKNKPLSSIGQRRVRVIQKETTEKGSFSPAPKEVRVALPIASLEEITPHPKKWRTRDKGKEKVGASVWADARMALARAHEAITLEELKEISGVPSYEMVSHHVHKLI